MKFLFFILFLAFISCQCFSQVVVQIKGHSDTIYSLHPNETQNIDELIPLEKFFKEKKVIGMGEATHGTKEFFNMKAKMFKFLATYCGYKVFSIEATYGGTLKINDYVLYGKGDCLLYTSDAADERSSVDLGGRRIIKKKQKIKKKKQRK